MLLIFSCYPSRTLHDYFLVGEGARTYPSGENFLSRNAFTALHNQLQFDVETIHSSLSHSFQHHLIPSTSTCVDEVRIGCKSSDCLWVKFNPRKADRWAIESLSLNDASGYLFAFTCPSTSITPFKALLFFGDLLSHIRPAYEITADTRFSNAKQAAKLFEMGVLCTLVCHASSPTELFKNGLAKDLPEPWAAAASNGSLIATTVWSQKKVNIISSWWTVSERSEKASYQERRVPLQHYDNTKAYGDTFQQLYAAYHFKHKHRHWRANLLIGWFEYAITNAYILHRIQHGDDLSHKEFLLRVGEALVSHPIE